ncbi:hypothetical protein [Novacetimonas hansenii]|uniref:Uncharacterized protein n=1 Tax=Novacetimonas hansenii TaxID=436 RepID=A0AAW5ELQ1_NOVHA|nr:hypothetical protein [Novacetimonas hansenii]MCJ8352728.1 hypothetical protein [Novacetimonas hansenii]
MSNRHASPPAGGHAMMPLSGRQADRLRDRLPTSEEIAAYALLFSVIWGALVLLFVGCLP